MQRACTFWRSFIHTCTLSFMHTCIYLHARQHHNCAIYIKLCSSYNWLDDTLQFHHLFTFHLSFQNFHRFPPSLPIPISLSLSLSLSSLSLIPHCSLNPSAIRFVFASRLYNPLWCSSIPHFGVYPWVWCLCFVSCTLYSIDRSAIYFRCISLCSVLPSLPFDIYHTCHPGADRSDGGNDLIGTFGIVILSGWLLSVCLILRI